MLRERKRERKIVNRLYVLGIFIVLLFAGCNNKGNKNDSDSAVPNASSSIELKYAKGFNISHFDNYTKVAISNPWSEDGVFVVYYLCKTDSANVPTDGYKLQIPIKSIVVNTFSYFEFLKQLDELDKVKGVTDGFRIYNPEILDGLKNKTIVDLGDPFNPNFEKTLAIRPDAIVKSAYTQMDMQNERKINVNIPVIYTLEWMENSPLARAEWIKLIAAFFDKSTLADSVFNDIEFKYLAKKESASQLKQKPTVLSGDSFQGTWYVPGGNSFNAILFNDAGLDYLYKDNSESGSIGLDIETILTEFGSAEFWFGCESDSYQELSNKDSKYMLLKSVKNRHVFNNRKRITASGGNDYFESSIAHPDLLLTDLIKAVQPELVPNEDFTYIQPLK